MLLGGNKPRWALVVLLGLVPLIAVIVANGSSAAGPDPFFSPIPGSTTIVSISSAGDQGNDDSDRPNVSADGRYVAFESRATNLVDGDINRAQDIFVHDRETDHTILVSVSSDGSQANGYSEAPSISGDGRWVAFVSVASNLVNTDTNRAWDVFVHDLTMGQTVRVSVASDGEQANADSFWPAISQDGRYVAFQSMANNLVISDTNRRADIFVHDLQTAETTRVSVGPEGREADGHSLLPSISANGRYVAFVSYATNLVSGDTNGVGDIFVHDRDTGETTRVSVASDGAEAKCDWDWRLCSSQPSISADGRHVAFVSYAYNLVEGDTNVTLDVFVHDRDTGETTRVSVASDGGGGSYSQAPSMSGDGRLVAFWSYASNLVADDANGWVEDIFVRDRQASRTALVSISSSGVQANAGSKMPAFAADGCCVAFRSVASNLVRGGTNGLPHIFVRDLELGAQTE